MYIDFVYFDEKYFMEYLYFDAVDVKNVMTNNISFLFLRERECYLLRHINDIKFLFIYK